MQSATAEYEFIDAEIPCNYIDLNQRYKVRVKQHERKSFNKSLPHTEELLAICFQINAENLSEG